jgi:phosphoglycolate phosphatase-like HAD superfamily hydrolase
MLRYGAVVFDLDGTLIDSYRAVVASMNAARAAFGHPPLPRETIVRRVGEPLEQLVGELVDRSDVERGVAAFRECYARVFLERSKPIPHAVAAVTRLAEAGAALAVASNKPARFGKKLLEEFGLSPPIRVVLGPEPGLPPKPDPTMIRRAIHGLGVSPSDTLYVGDVPLDRVSGERAGVDVALVATGAARAADLEGGREPVFRNLGELTDWLSGIASEMTADQK